MLRALFWKHWRETRALRAILTLAGAVLLVLTVLGGTGHGPAARLLKTTRPVELYFEYLPWLLAMGVWPLAALLCSSQAFAGDRADGREAFLLERPVPGSRLWLARNLAALAAWASVAALTAGLWGVLVLAGGPAETAWKQAAWVLAGVGPAAALAAQTAASAAALAAPSTLSAFLLGGFLAVLPPYLAVTLARWTPLAQWDGLPLAYGVAPALLGGMAVLSLWVQATGEPAGSRRLLRTGLGFAVLLAFSFSIFAATASWRVRAETFPETLTPHPVPAPAGSGAMLMGKGALILDAGEPRVRWSVPRASAAAWLPDGSAAAVLTWAGPLGSLRPAPELVALDTRGRPQVLARRTIHGDVHEIIGTSSGFAWIGFSLMRGEDALGETQFIEIWNPRSGRILRQSFPPGREVYFHSAGVDADGHWILLETPRGRTSSTTSVRLLRVRLDEDRGNIRFDVLYQGSETIVFLWREHRLSASGRFWISSRDEGAGSSWRVLGLPGGEDFEIPGLEMPFTWLHGDLLVWIETRDGGGHVLHAWDPVRGARALDGLPLSSAARVWMWPSPDRKRLLVVARMHHDRGAREAGSVKESRGSFHFAVYDPADGRWIGPHPLPREVPSHRGIATWANPSRLWLLGPGYAALMNVDGGGMQEVLGP